MNTICANCKYHITKTIPHYMDSQLIIDYCYCAISYEKPDLITGKIKEKYKFCKDVNTGNCKYYRKKNLLSLSISKLKKLFEISET